MTPTVSIIIVTYNSAEHIEACLAALRSLDGPPDHEVIVVDNASQDASVALVRAAEGVRLLEEAQNWGFAGGVNHGVVAARGELIALLNPDAAPRPDWLRTLVAALDDPQVGVAGSKILGSDGRIQSVGTLLQLPVLLSAHRGDGEADTGQYDQPAEVWSVHGAAMAFPRRVWQEVGGFDEGYFPAYWEESDFCERVRRAGYRVVTAPRAVVRHIEATATGKYSAEFYAYYHRNRLRYAARWLEWPQLWAQFRPAEHARLFAAPLLDRRVARQIYTHGVPTLEPLDDTQRAAVLQAGRALRTAPPADGFDPILSLLAEAESNTVLPEVTFESRLPVVARLRTAWNNVATRWYVRPALDQQTRYNLATSRALRAWADQQAARAAADALDVALLVWACADRDPVGQ